MNGIKEFRAVMDFAGEVARENEEPVSPMHVAFALAVAEAEKSPVSRVLIAFGRQQGWPVSPKQKTFGRRLLPQRRHAIEPRLQQEIERVAASGAPQIRILLRSFCYDGTFDAVKQALSSTNQTLEGWLGQHDE